MVDKSRPGLGEPHPGRHHRPPRGCSPGGRHRAAPPGKRLSLATLALGAKLGNPDRDVVCVPGDGAAGFNFMEMQSAVHEGLDLTTVVFAEGSWAMEEPNERLLHGRTFGTAMGTVRWDVVGQGLGCAGSYTERLEEVEPALEGAKVEKGPAVVCIRTDRDANLATPGDPLMRFVEVYAGPAS